MKDKDLALLARDFIEDKKGEETVVLDISKLTSFAHYFVICHGNSAPHVRAIAENVHESMKKKGEPLFHLEGLTNGDWVLLDYGAVIVHVFHREKREFYNLESLWGDAKVLYRQPADSPENSRS